MLQQHEEYPGAGTMLITLGYLSLFTVVTGDHSRWKVLQNAFGTFNKVLFWEKMNLGRTEVGFFFSLTEEMVNI